MSLQERSFSDGERLRILETAAQINPGMGEEIASYGVPAQAGLLTLSNKMMHYVKEKDRGNAGMIIRDLMKKLDEADPDRGRGSGIMTKLFKKSPSSQELLSRYHKMSAQLDRVTLKLENSKNVLLADVAMLDELFAQNQSFFKELNVYIEAAELKLRELQQEVIPELEISKDPVHKQKGEDTARFAERLDRRLYDLKVSREITRQSAPQIRLIQQTNQLLIDKIQSSILTAIPLWKNQITMESAMLRQKKARETQADMNRMEEGAAGKPLNDTKEELRRNLEDSLKIQETAQLQRQAAEAGLAAGPLTEK
ncbi:toxic anion resistance protein [Metabacillus sp. KIGAM252]|uniref:Toxic anion resistance protein n=1 Tax=Metabacillus flavus TaxID=2823519 RepID=A0ABS5LB25_9BACI|nr:toxic anion resistance protein [Metabacillus flavus]MBS2967654.1 toxic anion resistance protein [Metabacillus flavus]